ncbi:MAG: nuclear transport factor 2 family protein [Caulobacteraceae bacterium]
MLVSLLAGLGAPSTLAAAAPGEADLRAADAGEVADFLAADARGLAGLWADSFVVTNPLNQLAARAQVLAMVGSGVLRFTSYERKIEYLRAYGDIAIVAGSETVVWAGRMPMAGKLSHLRFTAVWRRSPAGWREIARHANIIPDR